VISWNGEDAGRIVEHDEGDAIYVVDIIFRLDLQGKGLGSALIGALQQEWAGRGRGGRAMVVSGNIPSLRMWNKAGFAGGIMADQLHFDLRWYPPGHPKHVARR
jgi:GNAT superfamily N-acetyltransferase